MRLSDFLDLKQALLSVNGFRVNSLMIAEEDRIDAHPFSIVKGDAQLLESNPVNVSSVKFPEYSKVYFLDGVQRTVLLGEVDGYPLFLHFSGSAVVARHGKDLSAFGEPRLKVCLITHDGVKIDSSLPVERVNSSEMSDYNQLSSLLRKKLEQDLFKQAVKFVGGSEILVYDGPLFYTDALKSANIVGVIKRHSVLYLPSSKMISSLEVGERSPAFSIERGTDGATVNIVSFYLRLFKRRNPYYGVVRVEASKSLLDSADKIDLLASFIFSERFPTSFLTHQSDKKLYPISVCEKYLSSSMPSVDLLAAFLSDA